MIRYGNLNLSGWKRNKQDDDLLINKLYYKLLMKYFSEGEPHFSCNSLHASTLSLSLSLILYDTPSLNSFR